MKAFTVLMAMLLVLCPAFQEIAIAEQVSQHVVSTDELQALLVAKSAERAENIKAIKKLLNNELIQERLGKLVNLRKIEKALPILSDEMIDQLAAESRRANDQFQAGLGTGAKIGIIIGVAVGVFLIVMWQYLEHSN